MQRRTPPLFHKHWRNVKVQMTGDILCRACEATLMSSRNERLTKRWYCNSMARFAHVRLVQVFTHLWWCLWLITTTMQMSMCAHTFSTDHHTFKPTQIPNISTPKSSWIIIRGLFKAICRGFSTKASSQKTKLQSTLTWLVTSKFWNKTLTHQSGILS